MENGKTIKTALDTEVELLHEKFCKELVKETGDCAIIAKHENGRDAVSIVGGTGFIGSLLLYILSQNQDVFNSLMNHILFGKNKGYRHLAKKIARIDPGILCQAIDTETDYHPILIPGTATKEEIIAIIEQEYEQRASKTAGKGEEADA